MSWMPAHTMVRQLVSKVQGIDLMGALPHEAPQAFEGLGTPNVAVHEPFGKHTRLRDALHLRRGCARLRDSASDISRVLAARFEPRIFFLLLLPNACQCGGDLLLLAPGNGSEHVALFVNQAALTKRSGKERRNCREQPIMPIGHNEIALAHSARAQIL